ncbi:MAG: M56 family metallopeptidase [Lacisediminihabitans sp.]
MIYSVYLPMIVVCVLALAGPVVSRNLAPSTSTRFLSALAVLSAAATIGTLVLLAVGGMVKMLPLLGIGADRERLVGGRDGVPWPVGVVAAVGLAMVAVRVFRAAANERRTLQALKALVEGSGEGLLVLEDSQPYAYAVPVGTGTVIVSTAMLNTLTDPERRALLAHEQAHLTHHHYRYQLIAITALAINPLLGRVRRELKLQTERWADESAAQQATRPVTARSLARAALASAAPPPTAMAYSTDHIRERLAALAVEPPTSHWATVIPLAVVVTIGSAALLDAITSCATLLALFYP